MHLELPPHRSYSQLTTWLKCQRQYYLQKVAKVPERPAVYLVAGTAIHEAIEQVNHESWRSRQHASTD